MAPQVRDPGEISDDVSLVQPYDGGGYGFAADSTPMVRNQLSTVGVTGFVELVTTGPDQIFRILAVSAIPFVGDATRLRLNIIETPPARQAFISNQVIILAATAEIFIFDSIVPIMGPNSALRIDWENGQPTFQFNTTTYGVLAPLGTAFTV